MKSRSAKRGGKASNAEQSTITIRTKDMLMQADKITSDTDRGMGFIADRSIFLQTFTVIFKAPTPTVAEPWFDDVRNEKTHGQNMCVLSSNKGIYCIKEQFRSSEHSWRENYSFPLKSEGKEESERLRRKIESYISCQL